MANSWKGTMRVSVKGEREAESQPLGSQGDTAAAAAAAQEEAGGEFLMRRASAAITRKRMWQIKMEPMTRWWIACLTTAWQQQREAAGLVEWVGVMSNLEAIFNFFFPCLIDKLRNLLLFNIVETAFWRMSIAIEKGSPQDIRCEQQGERQLQAPCSCPNQITHRWNTFDTCWHAAGGFRLREKLNKQNIWQHFTVINLDSPVNSYR